MRSANGNLPVYFDIREQLPGTHREEELTRVAGNHNSRKLTIIRKVVEVLAAGAR